MKTRDDIRDDLPLFALGALEPAERAAVQAALAGGDAELASELQEWTELIGLMAFETPAAAPPSVKARLLARVRADAAAAPRAAKLARRRIGWAIPLAAAATALLAIAGVGGMQLRSELARTQETVRVLERALAASKADLAERTEALARRDDDVGELRAALADDQASEPVRQQRGVQMVSLKQGSDERHPEGQVLFSPFSGRALFYAYNLPAIPSDKAYQLWWITDQSGAVPAAIFRSDGLGRGGVETQTPGGMIRAAAVTVEEEGGAVKPKGPMVLLGTLAAEDEELPVGTVP